jgi:hypothetical protein
MSFSDAKGRVDLSGLASVWQIGANVIRRPAR